MRQTHHHGDTSPDPERASSLCGHQFHPQGDGVMRNISRNTPCTVRSNRRNWERSWTVCLESAKGMNTLKEWEEYIEDYTRKLEEQAAKTEKRRRTDTDAPWSERPGI